MSIETLLALPVTDLELSIRSRNALLEPERVWKDGQYVGDKPTAATIGELIAFSERELLRLPNFGRKSLGEVREALAAYGLYLRGEEPQEPAARPPAATERAPDFVLENVSVCTEGGYLARCFVRVGPFRLTACLDQAGTVLLDSTLHDPDLRYAIGVALRRVALEKIAEMFAREDDRDDRQRQIRRRLAQERQ